MQYKGFSKLKNYGKQCTIPGTNYCSKTLRCIPLSLLFFLEKKQVNLNTCYIKYAEYGSNKKINKEGYKASFINHYNNLLQR